MTHAIAVVIGPVGLVDASAYNALPVYHFFFPPPPMFGLPIGSTVALMAVVALLLLAYGLHCIDRHRGTGPVTVLGSRASSNQ